MANAKHFSSVMEKIEYALAVSKCQCSFVGFLELPSQNVTKFVFSRFFEFAFFSC